MFLKLIAIPSIFTFGSAITFVYVLVKSHLAMVLLSLSLASFIAFCLVCAVLSFGAMKEEHDRLSHFLLPIFCSPVLGFSILCFAGFWTLT